MNQVPPLGVLVLSVLTGAAGILLLLAGLQLMSIVTFGPIPSGNGVFLTGLLTFVVGLIFLGAAGSLYTLQPFGLLFCEVMAIVGLVNAVLILFLTGDLPRGVGALIIPVVVLWYANRDDIQRAFSSTSRR
jgi:hypothetical protein